MTIWWESCEEGSADSGMKSLQFHNCGIIDDNIWFYDRISLFFMSFSLPEKKSRHIRPHETVRGSSSIFQFETLTMTFYWYYQFFINIIFISFQTSWMRVRTDRRVKRLFVNAEMAEMNGKYQSVTIHNTVRI